MSGRRTEHRELAAARLACGGTFAGAGAAAGVSERAVLKWNTDPTFRAMVRDFRRQAIGRAVGALADSFTDAARVLRDLLASANERVRLKAAAEILNLGTKCIEAHDLAAELDELRAALAELQARRGAK